APSKDRCPAPATIRPQRRWRRSPPAGCRWRQETSNRWHRAARVARRSRWVGAGSAATRERHRSRYGTCADPALAKRRDNTEMAFVLARRPRLGNVLAPLDPSHQSFELLRGLGAEIGVVHSAQLLGDGKYGLGPQANNVVFGVVVVGQRHLGSAYLRPPYQAVCEDHQRRHGANVPLRPLRPWSGARLGPSLD